MSKPNYIDSIGNAHGGLEVIELNGKFFWAIDGYGSEDFDENSIPTKEIPKSLYDSLIEFNSSLNRSEEG